MAPLFSKVSYFVIVLFDIFTPFHILGDLYNDTVTIAPGITISQQSIGVAFNSSGIYPRDGILG